MVKVEWIAVFLVMYIFAFASCGSCSIFSMLHLVFCVACLCIFKRSGQANLKLDLHLGAVWGQR